jgi:threonine/homoserine/homoserine lactone efflux protein
VVALFFVILFVVVVLVVLMLGSRVCVRPLVVAGGGRLLWEKSWQLKRPPHAPSS